MQTLSSTFDENSRLVNLEEQKVVRRVQNISHFFEKTSTSTTFRHGQFVIFPRSFYEQSTLEPTSDIANKYYAKWGLPARIVKVKSNQLEVVEYATGCICRVPASQCRILPDDIPPGIRELNWDHIQHSLPR